MIKRLLPLLLLVSCVSPSYVQKCPYSAEYICNRYYQDQINDFCEVHPKGRECRTYQKIQEDRSKAREEKRCYGHEWCKYKD